MKNFILLFTILLFAITNSYAQADSVQVPTQKTDAGYNSGEANHMVIHNPSTNLNKLFLFIPGTSATPSNYYNVCLFAGNLGYDVISLSYLNSVGTATLATSTDSLAFGKYRQEICFGSPVSDDIVVDTLNSITTRTLKLINYLDTAYPSQNWNQYLVDSTTINWSKVAVAGHSQGGGHAYYLAKKHLVDRTIAFSSPNDYSSHYNRPALWLSDNSNTPSISYYAYLNIFEDLDQAVVNFANQLESVSKVGIFPRFDTVNVDNNAYPYNGTRCLYTAQQPSGSGSTFIARYGFHNSTVIDSTTINKSAWTHLLTSDVTSVEEYLQHTNTLQLSPNPASSSTTITSSSNIIGKTCRITNINGVTSSNFTINANPFTIDISSLAIGMYFIIVDENVIKLLKQ